MKILYSDLLIIQQILLKMNQSKFHLKAVVEQTTNNTTSWIGRRKGETKGKISGQTFICPTEGELDSIEIFSTLVTEKEPVVLSLHSFDAENKTWGPVLETSTVELTKEDSGKWISFPIGGIRLQKGNTYGFRLQSEGELIGLGEALGSYDHTLCIGGQEWLANEGDQKGNYYSYLSLAFKIDLRA